MKILVLSCSTGGGHNACAHYIEKEFADANITCHYQNYLDLIDEKASSLIEKLYLDSTKGKGMVFKEVYKIGELYNKTNITSPVYLLNKLGKEKLIKYIEDNHYDLIICTHLFPSMALTEIKKEYPIKFINVATDYECIPFWNETNPDYFVIPSKLLASDFIKKGISKDILLHFGIPVASQFKKAKIIDFKTKYPKVLITSGSMGFGKMVDLTKVLTSKFSEVYFIVICGNNQKLYNSLKELNCTNLLVLGYTTNMQDYMGSADIIITKPGGLTTSEVATLHKPLIHMMPIPGVENYNANFFESNKMSLKATNEDEVVKSLELLLNNPKLQKELTTNQKKIINENSALDLVKFVKNNFK